MSKALSFRQYRSMDVFFFTSLLCICESLIVLSATRWFPAEPYALSLTPAIVAIVLMRWGLIAAVPAVAGAVVFCFLSGAALSHYVIYCVGNLAALALIFLIRRAGWQKIKENVLLCMLYALLSALLMQLGRAVIALIFGHSPIECLGFITTDVLSTLFSVVLLWIMRKLDGMIENQEHYLIRIQQETDQSKGV